MRFQGTITNPNTGEKEEIDVEAIDESPDFTTKITDDGTYKLISLDHPDADEGPRYEFYIADVELTDGTIIELKSTDLPDGVELIDETVDEFGDPIINDRDDDLDDY